MALEAHYEEFLANLIRPLLSEPEALELRSKEDQGGLTLLFRVHPDDTGRIIGKGGAGITSLRNLVTWTAQRRGDFVAVELQDG